jgi:hypothetical protein
MTQSLVVWMKLKTKTFKKFYKHFILVQHVNVGRLGPEHEGRMPLRNVGVCLQVRAALQSGRLTRRKIVLPISCAALQLTLSNTALHRYIG